jgi:two-component system response regulator NreC
MINVLLVEDHDLVRSGLKALLESDSLIKVVSEVDNGEKALKLLSTDHNIDLVITDLSMPALNGIELCLALTNMGSTAKVLLLSMHGDRSHIYKAFESGAAGYLIKDIYTEELLFTVHYVMDGGRYLCAALAMDMIDSKLNIDTIAKSKSQQVDLSIRELEVLQLIANGITNQGISDRLTISKRTVEGHRKSMIVKCKVNNTAELIYFAMKTAYIH